MNQIAVISDIHGNIPALDAVLEDINAREIHRIICLGDIAGKGPSSAEAVDLIEKHCEQTVKGNWDFFMTEQDSKMLKWHQERLGQERLNFLRDLPIYLEFYMSGRLIRLCHASPNDIFHRTFLSSKREERLKLFEPTNTLDQYADVVGYGDIHGAHVECFDGKSIFNAGSVGNPLELTQASYAIIEGQYESQDLAPFSISIVKVPYNINQAVADAMETDMPEKEAYIHEIKTAEYRGKLNRKLSKKAFKKIDKFMNKKARDLEKALYNYHFVNENETDVLDALENYQNEDGGFGKGIESDFQLPDSSPMATSVGLRYLSRIDTSQQAQTMIEKAIKYLEKNYEGSKNGWYSVPKEVNDYPHAPWWTYKEDIQMTVIDYSWGNPTAELIGYMYKYRQYLSNFDIYRMIDYGISKLNDMEEFKSEHEIYSYIRMYTLVDKDHAEQMVNGIKRGIQQLVNLNEKEWDQYVPMPLHFINYDSNYYFGIDTEYIIKNLEHLMDKIEEQGLLSPSWEWQEYKEEWEVAKKEWTGVLNFEALLMLKKFKRLK